MLNNQETKVMNSNRPKRENTQSSASSPSSAEVYEILVQGELDSLWDAWFEGMSLLKVINGESGVVCTSISGEVADQAALHGLLIKIRDLNLPLISVRRVKPGSDQGDSVNIDWNKE
jgi:hypothetical protein